VAEYTIAMNLSEALGIRWKGNLRANTFANNVIKILTENSTNKVIVIAHNGHIGKLKKEVGALLKNKLGDKYFAIGTDYEEGEFSLWNLKDNKKRFIDTLYTPKLENSFSNKFSTLPGEFHYVSLVESGKTNSQWANQENYIVSIGMGFNRDLTPIDFSRKVILKNYFDGIFIFKKIHPLNRLE